MLHVLVFNQRTGLVSVHHHDCTLGTWTSLIHGDPDLYPYRCDDVIEIKVDY